MIYLFTGEDWQAKEQQVAKIKSACKLSGHALKFDYELLYGEDLDPAVLKKSLMALPAIVPQRLVLIREAQELDKQNQNIVLEFLKKDQSHLVLVLDWNGVESKDDFYRVLASAARTVQFAGKGKRPDVWAATRAIERRQPAMAIKILTELMESGERAETILGALVWFWGNIRGRLSAERFKKGLLVLQEADLNVKRARMDPVYAVQVAVTNLSQLTGV
jgi:DNA polymerase III delta subunit